MWPRWLDFTIVGAFYYLKLASELIVNPLLRLNTGTGGFLLPSLYPLLSRLVDKEITFL
jgi:hypothetical protein